MPLGPGNKGLPVLLFGNVSMGRGAAKKCGSCVHDDLGGTSGSPKFGQTLLF